MCYFIGFNVDRERFKPDKPLHVDVAAYNFHKMLVDKYKGTMKDGLDWYVEHFPWKKLPKEVFEPFGGRDAAKKLREEKGYGKYATKKAGKDGKDGKDGEDGEMEMKETDGGGDVKEEKGLGEDDGKEEDNDQSDDISKSRKRVIQHDFRKTALGSTRWSVPPVPDSYTLTGSTGRKRSRDGGLEQDQEQVDARRLKHLESRSKDVHWVLDPTKA